MARRAGGHAHVHMCARGVKINHPAVVVRPDSLPPCREFCEQFNGHVPFRHRTKLLRDVLNSIHNVDGHALRVAVGEMGVVSHERF